MRALALDVGAKTIGLAVSDPSFAIATSHGVLERHGEASDVRAITSKIAETQASYVVLGLPLELDGTAGHRARRVERFRVALAAHLAIELGAEAPRLESFDERFSTAAAERTLLEANVSRAKRREVIDGLAAQFILQGWLDRRAFRREREP